MTGVLAATFAENEMGLKDRDYVLISLMEFLRKSREYLSRMMPLVASVAMLLGVMSVVVTVPLVQRVLTLVSFQQ